MRMYYTKATIEEKTADSFTAIASTEVKDRHGEIVKADGWDLKNYKKNPILLFMHDHTKPIGKASRIWLDKASGKSKLMFKGILSTATEEARAAKQLMEEGILSSFSVGFMPLEMDGSTITKSELHEISLVSVGANPEARVLAAKSLKTAGFDEDIIKTVIAEEREEDEDELQAIREELKEIRQTAELAVKGLQHLNPQRSKQVTQERLSMLKVIAKASDKLLEKDMPHEKRVAMHKVIKRSSEILIRSHKGDL